MTLGVRFNVPESASVNWANIHIPWRLDTMHTIMYLLVPFFVFAANLVKNNAFAKRFKSIWKSCSENLPGSPFEAKGEQVHRALHNKYKHQVKPDPIQISLKRGRIIPPGASVISR